VHADIHNVLWSRKLSEGNAAKGSAACMRLPPSLRPACCPAWDAFASQSALWQAHPFSHSAMRRPIGAPAPYMRPRMVQSASCAALHMPCPHACPSMPCLSSGAEHNRSDALSGCTYAAELHAQQTDGRHKLGARAADCWHSLPKGHFVAAHCQRGRLRMPSLPACGGLCPQHSSA